MSILLFEKIINFLLPTRCVICGAEVLLAHTLCKECFMKINFISDPCCKLCGSELPYENFACINCTSLKDIFYDQIKVVFKYDDFSKKLILKFKHGDKPQLAKFFSNIMSPKISSFERKFDYILPVPIHWKRYIKRKYNQSYLLAKLLSRKNKIKISYKELIRVKNTIMQHGDINIREKNVKNAFFLKSNIFHNKSILIIDDVVTTGSTINECARILKEDGKAASVSALAIAKI